MAEMWNKYEPTAARKRGKPGRETRPKSLTVDMHAHVVIPQAFELVKGKLDMSTIPLAHFSDAATKALNAKQEADLRERIGNTDERFKVMDDMGVDMQLVCPAPPQIWYTVPLDISVKSNHVINDGIAEYVGKHTDRLVALGGVPMADGHEAAKELERCMKQLKFKGVEILTNVGGKELSDPAFEPFWKKAEELGALVIIHPNGFTQADRLSRFYFNNVVGNPLETTIALHYLIFDGVLERHPNLKIFAMHGGGYLGGYSGRIDHAWGARSDSRGGLPKPPTALPEEERDLRHGGVHADPARGAGQDLRRRSRRARHRLSVRHGGLRSDRACGVDRVRCVDHGGHLRRQRRSKRSSSRAS